jgi:hypothetical protein
MNAKTGEEVSISCVLTRGHYFFGKNEAGKAEYWIDRGIPETNF